MADLNKIMSQIVKQIRKLPFERKAPAEIVMSYAGPGKSSLSATDSRLLKTMDVPHDFADEAEMDRALAMLGAGFPGAKMSRNFDPGMGALIDTRNQELASRSIDQYLQEELPDFSPEELAGLAAGYGRVKQALNIPDVNDLDMLETLISEHAGDADAMLADLAPGPRGMPTGRSPR